jgi:hypothetical protein
MGRMMHEARHGLPLEADCKDILGHWHAGSHDVSMVSTLPVYLAVVAVQERARGCSIAVMPWKCQKTSSIIPRCSLRFLV